VKKFTLPQVKNPSETPARSALEEVLRDGAKRLLQEAIEYEVLEYVQKFKEMKDEMNNRLVTRNGYLPARDIQTGIGPISVRQPRIRDKRDGQAFSSVVIPKYKRKTESLERLIPELYFERHFNEQFSRSSLGSSWQKCYRSFTCKYYSYEGNLGARIRNLA